MPAVVALRLSDRHEPGQKTHIAARKLNDHLPERFRKLLAHLALGRDALFLHCKRPIAQVHEPFDERLAALGIEPGADVIERLFIEVLDEKVVLVLHLQIDDDVRVLLEVHRLHLQDLRAPPFDRGKAVGKP